MRIEKLLEFPNDLIDEAQVPVFSTTRYANYVIDVKSKRAHVNVLWFAGFINDTLLFIIPFVILKKAIFKKGYFLTEVINFTKQDKTIEKEFLEGVVEIIKKNKLCDWIQQPPTWVLFNVIPSKSIFCEFATYKINLHNNTEDELYDRLDKSAKYEIRKALKNKIIIKNSNETIEDSSKVFAERTLKGDFKFPSKNDIEKLFCYFSDNIKLYSSYYNSIPQTSNIVIFNKLCAYGLYSATIEKPLYGSNYLLFWEIIKDLKKIGIKYFNFVGARINPAYGSKQERIQRFKENFGVEIFHGYLWKMPISKVKYAIFIIMLKIFFSVRLKKYKGDMIDQELRRNKMKKIILTIDYELFLGSKTGSVKDCMIKPTDKLISYLDKNNSKMTVFWDILHYYQLLKFENNFSELKEDRLLIEKQILKLAEKGHDIQLHLHPNWLDAKYQNGKWEFQYDRFKLHKLTNEDKNDDINSILGCITISKNLIENLIRKVNPDYKVTTFRAGGCLIEPFNKLKDSLAANDIKIDSSVCPGLFIEKKGFNSFDFRNYPLKLKYNFDTSPRFIVDDGIFTEIPITTIKLPLLRNIYYKLLGRIKYSTLKNEKKGTSAGVYQNHTIQNKIKKNFSIFFESERIHLTTDGKFLEKFNYIYKNVPEYATMILHPKLLNNHTLKILDNSLSTKKIKFISIKDFVN